MSAGVPLLAVSGSRRALRRRDRRPRQSTSQVGEGEIVSIVGPNGAGKTSLVSAIAGIVPPGCGHHRSLPANRSPASRSRMWSRRAIALVPEGRHIFASLTVIENLLLGATVPARQPTACAPTSIASFAMFPILGARRRQPAGQLSGGEQQQLAIARALISRPRLLDARRAVARLGADGGRPGLCAAARRCAHAGRDHSARRAECRARIRRSPTASM